MADGFEEFDAAVNSLKQRLMELGATPEQAERAAVDVASSPSPTTYRQTPEGALEVDIGAPARLPKPTRVQPMDETGVRAGAFGLPPLPRNALAGPELRSTNTPMGDVIGAYDTGLGALASKAERGSGMLLRGASELTGVPQAIRAGEAVGEAALDPSLANVTNAGANTAIAVGRPITAGAAMLGGLGVGLAKDSGAFDMGAQAQSNAFPNLPPEINAEYGKLKDLVGRGRYRTYDERDNMLRRMKQIEDLSNTMILNQANTANQGQQTKLAEEEKRKSDDARVKREEYDRAVKTAEVSRDTALARDRRFSETDFGKVWDKTAGTMPGLIAAPMGAVTRLATGGKTFAHKWGIPIGMGAAEGAVASNIPIGFNALATEPDNPEKRAFQAYARDLPPDHPRKAEFAEYAKTLPDENPVRAVAMRDAVDPWNMVKRGFLGALEGSVGALAGNKVVGATERIGGGAVRSLASALPSRTGAAQTRAAGKREGTGSQLQREAASLERNALAGSEGVPSGVPGVRLGTGPQAVEPNALATGRTTPKPPSQSQASAQPPPLPERQSLPPATSTNPALEEILKKVEFDKKGIPYWKEGHGRIRGSNKLTLEERQMLGLEPKPSKTQTKKPQNEPPPEKPSVQIDDMAPMGKRQARTFDE